MDRLPQQRCRNRRRVHSKASKAERAENVRHVTHADVPKPEGEVDGKDSRGPKEWADVENLLSLVLDITIEAGWCLWF